MFLSIQIVSSLGALIFLLVLFTFLLRLKYFKNKYVRLFMKLWIDIAFLKFILAVVHISIPLQNSDLIYSILFIAYFLLFYYWRKTSVGSFMYLYDKIKEKNKAGKKEKEKFTIKLKAKIKTWRRAMYLFIAFVFLNMVVFPGHQLNDGSFKETEVAGYMVNDSGEILSDNSGDGVYYVGYFDRYGNDGVIDQVKYDLNKDNKVDLKYTLNDGNITETLADYSDARGVMIFFAVIFFIFILIKGRKSKFSGEQVIASLIIMSFVLSLFGDYKQVRAYDVPDCLDPLYTNGVLEGYFDDCDEYSGGVFIPIENMEAEYGDNDEQNYDDVSKSTREENTKEIDIDESNLEGSKVVCEMMGNKWVAGECSFVKTSDVKEKEVEKSVGNLEDDGEQEYNDVDFDYHEDRLNYDPEEDNVSNTEKYTDKDWEKTEKEDRRVIRELEERKLQQEKQKQNKLINDINLELDALDNNDILNQLRNSVKDTSVKEKKAVNKTVNSTNNSENKGEKKDYTKEKSFYDIVRDEFNDLTTEDENNLALSDLVVSNIKDSTSLAKDTLEFFGEKKIANEMRNLVRTHGSKSKAVTARINMLKDHINKLKSSGKGNIGGFLKADKKGIRGLQDFNSKMMKKRGTEVTKWTKAKKNLEFTTGVFGNIGKGLGVYGDYNDFNKEFKGDTSKAITATITQDTVGGILSANPVDAVMGAGSTIVSLLGYKKLASKMGDFTAGGVTKNIIKDSFTSSFKDIGGVISIEMNRIKNTEGIIGKTGAIITGGITSTYALGVSVVKVPLEAASYVIGGIGKAASSVTNKLLDGVSGLFSWRASRY